jgi:hypothetical protein
LSILQLSDFLSSSFFFLFFLSFASVCLSYNCLIFFHVL